MAYRYEETNADGLQEHSGPVTSGNLDSGTNHTKGLVKQLEMNVSVSGGLPSVGSAHTSKDFAIPSGASIVSAKFVATETFDAAVEFGTSQLDGTAIDQDGLIATGSPAANTVTDGAGAQIDTTIGEAGYLVVTATTAAPTTGAGKLVVEYII